MVGRTVAEWEDCMTETQKTVAFLIAILLVSGFATLVLKGIDGLFMSLIRKHYAIRQGLFITGRVLQVIVLTLMTLGLMTICYYWEHK